MTKLTKENRVFVMRKAKYIAIFLAGTVVFALLVAGATAITEGPLREFIENMSTAFGLLFGATWSLFLIDRYQSRKWGK